MNRFAWMIMLIVPFLGWPFHAAGQEIKSFSCPHCKSTGRVPNPNYDEKGELEAQVRYCSWAMEKDPEGWGLSWLPCKNCRMPERKAKAMAEFEKEVAARKKWLAGRREIDAYLKVRKPLLHVETEHFVWAWDIPKFKLGNKIIRGHDGLHLFAGRMEKFYGDFLEIHKIKPADNLYNFHRLYVFLRQQTGQAATGKYAQQYSVSGKMTLPGQGSSVVTWWERSKAPTEADLYRELVHNVTHLFTSSFKTGGWSYETGAVYEGIAHWWEIHFDGKASAYCRQEQDYLTNWIAEDWRTRVRKMVQKKKAPSLTGVLQKNGGSLNLDEHMFGWSYMDFMMSLDPRKTLEFIAILKQNKPPREAFLQVWGWSILGFEEQWIEHAKLREAEK